MPVAAGLNCRKQAGAERKRRCSHWEGAEKCLCERAARDNHR